MSNYLNSVNDNSDCLKQFNIEGSGGSTARILIIRVQANVGTLQTGEPDVVPALQIQSSLKIKLLEL